MIMRKPYGRHKHKWGPRSGKWQVAGYLHNSIGEKRESILTIRTRCVGGTTGVCRVHVCFLVCALISTSAAVQVKPGKDVEGEGRRRVFVSLGSLGLMSSHSIWLNLTGENIKNMKMLVQCSTKGLMPPYEKTGDGNWLMEWWEKEDIDPLSSPSL